METEFSVKLVQISERLLGGTNKLNDREAASFLEEHVCGSLRNFRWWLSVDLTIRLQVKALLLQALSSSFKEFSLIALKVLLNIARADLPTELYDLMQNSLCGIQSSGVDSMNLMKIMRIIIFDFDYAWEKTAVHEWVTSISLVFYDPIRELLIKGMDDGDFDNPCVNPSKVSRFLLSIDLLFYMVSEINMDDVFVVNLGMAATYCFDLVVRFAGKYILRNAELIFFRSMYCCDKHERAAILAAGFMMAVDISESSFHPFSVLPFMLESLNCKPSKPLKYRVVFFLRRFFEFQQRATVETLLAVKQSTCEQIFDILLSSMDDGPDIAENACHAVYFLAKCYPYLWNVLPKFSEQCVWSLHGAAHNYVNQSGLRLAAYRALHEVVRFVAAPVILKLISHFSFDLKKALRAIHTCGVKYILYECRGLKIILHKLGELKVTVLSFEQHIDGFAKSLLGVFRSTTDVECWKDAFISIGALAHAIGPAFGDHMAKFFDFWISGLQRMRAGELYEAMVVVMIRLSRALKGKIIAYYHKILSQLLQDLSSTDLHERSKCSILCCCAELALAIGADFYDYLGCSMDALGRLTSSKHDVLLKPESRHLICAMLETYFAIISCFEEPSVSHILSPFASNIRDFLHLICGLDMDAKVTKEAILFVRCLAAVPGEIFSSLIYKDKSIQSFLNQCSISKDPLIKAFADQAYSCLLDVAYNWRWDLLESEVSEKHIRELALIPVQHQNNKDSEECLLSFFQNLPQGPDSYETIVRVSLSSILSRDGEDVAKRILAGKILLKALKYEKNWDLLDYRSRSCISKSLVQALFSCEANVCRMAIGIMKHIGKSSSGFEFIWIELEIFLCSDVDHHQPRLMLLTLKMLAGVLKNTSASDRPSTELINTFHKAMIIKASECNDDIILNWLQVLHCSYQSLKFLSDDIKDLVFLETESPKVKLKVAALECLTALCFRYRLDLLEQSKVGSIMLKAMEETDKFVSHQAIVFWIAACQNEMQDGNNTDFVLKKSEDLVANLLKILFARSTGHLEPTDPDQQEETPNLTKTALKCLHFVAQTIGNKIILLVKDNVLLRIESSDVWEKQVGIRAFGSILVGPTGQALRSLITSAFSKVLHALEGCIDKSVSYAITWTLSQIFEFHHPIVKELMDRKYEHVIDFLQHRIKDVTIVTKNACHALSSLVQGVDADIWGNLSPYFDVLARSLYEVGHNESAGVLELKVAAYEALHELMKCANDENFEVMLCLTTVIMNDLSCALEAKEYTVEELKNQCRSLLVITQKLGTSEKYKPYFMQHVHQIITLLTKVLECESVIYKEALLAVGAIAYVNGGAFEEHMEKLEKCWEVGVQIFGQHMEVYVVMLRVIADVCRVLKKKMLPFCDKIMTPLEIGAPMCQREKNWGPSISCICEIAGAVGDTKFLKHAMGMLLDKTWFGEDRAYHLDVDNILYLRPGLVEAYRAIFQDPICYPVSDLLHRFVDDTLDVLLEFLNLLFQTDDMDCVIARGVFEVLEQMPLMSPSSQLKYTGLRKILVDHLCKPCFSPIHLVGGGPSTDDEVCRNKTTMISGGVPLEATVEGKIGSVRISSIEFDGATPTYVKVSVVHPGRGIHGQITAYNMRYPNIRRELFRRNSTNGSNLNSEANLKVNLYKGVLVVPLNSILVIKADLWCNLFGRESSLPYMKFSAEFNVTRDGSTSKAWCDEGGTGSTIIVEVYFGIGYI